MVIWLVADVQLLPVKGMSMPVLSQIQKHNSSGSVDQSHHDAPKQHVHVQRALPDRDVSMVSMAVHNDGQIREVLPLQDRASVAAPLTRRQGAKKTRRIPTMVVTGSSGEIETAAQPKGWWGSSGEIDAATQSKAPGQFPGRWAGSVSAVGSDSIMQARVSEYLQETETTGPPQAVVTVAPQAAPAATAAPQAATQAPLVATSAPQAAVAPMAAQQVPVPLAAAPLVPLVATAAPQVQAAPWAPQVVPPAGVVTAAPQYVPAQKKSNNTLVSLLLMLVVVTTIVVCGINCALWKNKAKACPGGCGYQVTSHSSGYCCGRCSQSNGHGRLCAKKAMPPEVVQALFR